MVLITRRIQSTTLYLFKHDRGKMFQKQKLQDTEEILIERNHFQEASTIALKHSSKLKILPLNKIAFLITQIFQTTANHITPKVNLSYKTLTLSKKKRKDLNSTFVNETNSPIHSPIFSQILLVMGHKSNK